MKFFASKTLQWWEVGLIKLAVLLIALAIGSHWAKLFSPHARVLGIVGILTGIYCLYRWLKH